MTNSLNLRFVRVLLASRSLGGCPGVSQVDGANVDDSCHNWGSWVPGTLLWWSARKLVQTSPQREMSYCSANKSACCPVCLGYSLFSRQKSLKRPSRRKDISTSTHEMHSQETLGESSSSNPEQWIYSWFKLFLPEFFTKSTNSGLLEFSLEHIFVYCLYHRQYWWFIVQLRHK